MTRTHGDKEAGKRKGAATEKAAAHPVYIYHSAGIAEREGEVPLWLWVVVVSLLVWGLYYLVTYWNAPLQT